MRTSYFPGLGWMMRRQLWLEIGPVWPKQSWDHWMRLNTTSKGCLLAPVPVLTSPLYRLDCLSNIAFSCLT